MKNHKIAVIPGDGTGPEVMREGVKVLKTACEKEKIKIDLDFFDYGGTRYLKSGELITEKDIEILKKYDAIYLGAIGHP
ncbi:MAG TPA: isocitrate/isopropylmalate family dehydrogenase, partial [bacterium]|nr:isocitrate/isopropylmalate family dehydrogenase [bacterium]